MTDIYGDEDDEEGAQEVALSETPKEMPPFQKKIRDCIAIGIATVALAYVPAIVSNLGKAFSGSSGNTNNSNDVFVRNGEQVRLDRTEIAKAQIALQVAAVDLVKGNPACVLSRGLEFDKSLLLQQQNPDNRYVMPPNTTALQTKINIAEQRLAAFENEEKIRGTLTDIQNEELRNVAKIDVLNDPYGRVAGLGQCFSSGESAKDFYTNLQIARGHQTEDVNPVQTGEKWVSGLGKWATDTVGNAAAAIYTGTVFLTGGGLIAGRLMRD